MPAARRSDQLSVPVRRLYWIDWVLPKGPGLPIQGATLPVALLLDHFEQAPVVFVKTLSTAAKSMAVKFQIAASEHETEHVHAGFLFTDRQRQPQPQDICCSRLCFDLAFESGIQKIDREQCLSQSGTQHLDIHGMGEVSEPALESLFHRFHPEQKTVGSCGKKMRTCFGRIGIETAEFKLPVALEIIRFRSMHGFSRQLEKRSQHLEISIVLRFS